VTTTAVPLPTTGERSPADRRAWRGAIATAVFVGLFVVLRLALQGWDLNNFVLPGSMVTHGPSTPAELHPTQGTGYDGQYVYRLARDPLTHVATDFGSTLDRPSYRQERIGLPVVAWALSGLTGLSAMVTILLVNALAVVGIGWLAAGYAVRHDRSPMWGVLVAAGPGLLIALSRDLTEPLAIFAALAGLFLWEQRRWAWAAVAFVVAVLTRETTLAIPAGIGIWTVAQGVRGGRPALRERLPRVIALVVGPLAVLVAWQLWLTARWGSYPSDPDNAGLGVPLVGVLKSLTGGALPSLPADGTQRGMVGSWTVERFALLAFLIYVAVIVWRSRASGELKAAWGCATLVAVSVGSWLWDAQFFRAAAEAWTLGLLVIIARPGIRARYALECAGLVSVFVGSVYLHLS
jgi:hypothetical protein